MSTDFSPIDLVFNKIEIAKEKALRAVTINAVAIISERIQNEGKTTDGKLINGGSYSKGYEKVRRKSGRRTSFVDLTDTGDMLDRGFRPQQVNENAWGVGLYGFKRSGSGRRISHFDLMAHFEKANGDIIQPSQEEETLLQNVLFEAINNEFI